MGSKPVVTREEDVWVLRVESESGKVQEYRCATEAQARQLALVLSAGTGGGPRPAARP
jgi:hypothetical protein